MYQASLFIGKRMIPQQLRQDACWWLFPCKSSVMRG